jgi:hypothetical protein
MSKPPIKQKYIKDPADILKAWNEYKAHIDNNPDIQQVATGRGVLSIEVKRPYLKQGFYSFFYNKYGHHVSQYFDNQNNSYTAYLDVISHIRGEWEQDQIEGSLTGRYKAHNLVARLNGLTEKVQNEITTPGTISIKFEKDTE